MQLAKQKKYESHAERDRQPGKGIHVARSEPGSPGRKKTLDLQNKRIEIKRFAEDAQKESMAAQQKEFESIQRDLMPIIEKIAKEDGYSMILDLNTAGVTYFEPGIDITEKVVKAYDAQSAAPAAPAVKK